MKAWLQADKQENEVVPKGLGETGILCLFLVSLQLAASFALVAVVLYASWCDPELFYHLLSRVLSQENYTALAYALGKILPVASEGLLPF
ncbi:hypothetical protein GRJ2_003109300 [Grus japonensis]|uniref:Uncharacterized protein n=1 Tax=Grus japonensis TaxID=30415 RepID=A0ABC9YBU0_GRUJA